MKIRLIVLFIPQLLLGILLCLTSCSGSDYINAIPEGSTALIAVDPVKIGFQTDLSLLKNLLTINEPADCGIGLTNRFFLFESPDGNLGLCAKVNDAHKLESTLTKLAKQKICQSVKQRRGFRFTVLKDSWVVGFSDKALLVMGPVTISAQSELQNAMAKYLKQNEDEGIKSMPIFNKLDSIGSPIAMVIQAQALPEKFVAPFTIGAPKNAEASQVLIAAAASIDNGCLDIKGETFSFNREVDKALKDAFKSYRPIKGRYAKSMPSNALMGMFVNVDGKKFINLLHNNKGLQALLTGINSAIDIDNIIRSVDGDMSIVIPSYTSDDLNLSMAAELSETPWLADIPYWMQSCPKGSRIVPWGKNAYYYTNDKTTFYFGVSPDKQFLSGNSKEQALASVRPTENPISSSLQQKIVGSKMVMIINWTSVENKQVAAFAGILKPVFGQLNSIVYRTK
jgi:hypothetical protein